MLHFWMKKIYDKEKISDSPKFKWGALTSYQKATVYHFNTSQLCQQDTQNTQIFTEKSSNYYADSKHNNISLRHWVQGRNVGPIASRSQAHQEGL